MALFSKKHYESLANITHAFGEVAGKECAWRLAKLLAFELSKDNKNFSEIRFLAATRLDIHPNSNPTENPQ